MKKLLFAAMGIAIVVASSCKKDIAPSEEKPYINVPGAVLDTLIGEITVNTTVTENTWLQGIVYVKPGVTLTINPGITIFGSPGGAVPDLVNLSNNKGTLLVERGGRLVANGTATSPIVWTSSQPNGSRNFGDWGGIVLYGRAPITTRTGDTVNTYEAFSAVVDARNLYGGSIANDNSGIIRYNRIEFAGGVVLTANQEVNGLTFSGVGSGTTVDFVEVLESGDDAFEFFGGTVNAKHLLSFSNKDDDFDFDEGYTGKLQFIIGFRSDLFDNSGSELIETDNNANAAVFAGRNRTRAFISNATLLGPSTLTPQVPLTRFDGATYIRRASSIILVNSLVAGEAAPSILGFTPTTVDLISTSGALDSIFIGFNVLAFSGSTPVVLDANESNPIGVVPVSSAVINKLAATNNSVASPNSQAGFKLNAVLSPLPGSPALSGGLPLTSIDPFFTNTAQRGAVITSDQWTSTGTWISIDVD